MRIAVCDDDREEQEQCLSALREWDPAVEPECFLSGAQLLAATENARRR